MHTEVQIPELIVSYLLCR